MEYVYELRNVARENFLIPQRISEFKDLNIERYVIAAGALLVCGKEAAGENLLRTPGGGGKHGAGTSLLGSTGLCGSWTLGGSNYIQCVSFRQDYL